MVGLIKKDLLMIKRNAKLVGVIFLIFMLMELQGNTNLAFVPAFISIMLFMSTFSYDEYNKWDSYAITFPKGREDIIKSKYVATFILTFGTIILTTILSLIVGYFSNSLDIEEITMLMLGSFFGIILVQAIMYPLIFKFGMEKGRIAFFVFTFGIAFFTVLIMRNVKISLPVGLVSLFSHYYFIILPVLMIIMIGISYFISKRIYLKKEF